MTLKGGKSEQKLPHFGWLAIRTIFSMPKHRPFYALDLLEIPLNDYTFRTPSAIAFVASIFAEAFDKSGVLLNCLGH
jgi:hypothetical protein